MEISARLTLNIAKVCLGFSIYDVQLPDIYVGTFFYNFKNLTYPLLVVDLSAHLDLDMDTDQYHEAIFSRKSLDPYHFASWIRIRIKITWKHISGQFKDSHVV